MPIIKSAKKRVKLAQKAGARNYRTKRSMREAIKAYFNAIDAGKSTDVAKAEQAAVSAIDRAAKKGVIHKNKAARKKAQLSAASKAAAVKKSKPTAKKPAAKKPAAKKTASAKKTK